MIQIQSWRARKNKIQTKLKNETYDEKLFLEWMKEWNQANVKSKRMLKI